MKLARTKLAFKDKPVGEQLRVAERLARGASSDAALAARLEHLPRLQKAVEEARTLIDAVETARKTLKAQVLKRNDAMRELRHAAWLLRAGVVSQTGGEAAALVSLGLELVAEKKRIGLLPAPDGLKALPGLLAGSVLLRWARVRRRRPSYLVEMSTDPDGNAGWKHVGAFTRRKCTVTGLEPGKEYWFRVATLARAGTGPWGSPVRCRAT
ncbi:MAG: fibronectin type III domain-containing protein [Verrucomicrobia bacterium]|nr:fibronectin type III domain-containing protein [Verrucomicrobiota bacterium]